MIFKFVKKLLHYIKLLNSNTTFIIRISTVSEKKKSHTL